MPYFDYLLENPEPSLNRQGMREQAVKDRHQALTPAQAIAGSDDEALPLALAAAAPAMRNALRSRLLRVLDSDELPVLRANGLASDER
ncbi:MAG: hypothetical protein AB7G13_12935 [Lautropia sp.]